MSLQNANIEPVLEEFIRFVNSSDFVNMCNGCDKPKEGYIDLFLEDDKFRVVIENKVKSGLNDIYKDDNDKQRSQLDKYQDYLEYRNALRRKKNYIFIFAPDYHCDFQTGEVKCKIFKYSELYNFFNGQKENIQNKINSYYYNLFLNSLAKHSHSLEDEIKERFIQVTRESNGSTEPHDRFKESQPLISVEP